MRKDSIEERIIGIERDMKELRSEVRQEIMAMSSELKETQLALVEDMVAGLQDTMSAGYRQIAYEISIGSAEKRFQEEMYPECPPGERNECIGHFVEEHLRKGITSLEAAPQDRKSAALSAIVEHDAENSREFRGTACERCQGIYLVERDRLLDMEKKFAEYRSSMAARRARPYYKQLPDDLTVSELIDPLSHRGRFIMLKNLTSGRMSFTALGEVTGYVGGHLIYHLNKLVAAGLVSKETDGTYRITEKGIDVMEVIRKMYAG